jgi:hypothetical protein
MMRHDTFHAAAVNGDARVVFCPNCGTPMKLQRRAQETSPVVIYRCRICNITYFDPVYEIELPYTG